MSSNNNFGNNDILVQNGSQDNNAQNNNYQENYQEKYGNNENFQGSENIVPLPSLAAGFKVYPFFPYEYYQPPGSNYAQAYMPNLFQPVSGFANNGFLQTTYTTPVNPVNSTRRSSSLQRGNTDSNIDLFRLFA